MRGEGAKGYKELLRAGVWFRSLTDDFQDALLSAATLRRYAPKESVFRRGDPVLGLCGTLEGAIRVGGSDAEGNESILVIAEPPTWFGEISLVDEGPMTHDAVAERASLLVHIAPAAIAELMRQRPERWRDIGRLMAMKVRLLFAEVEEYQLLSALPLLARRLVLITEGYGGWDDRTARAIEVGQEQLATMLGLSRQTANQLLKQLEARQLLRITYGGIEILDLAGLRGVAGRILMP